MRAAFGKVNTLHTHVLPWADRPLVINNLVGGEEGISDAGVSVARLIPIGNVFFEATGQVFRGDAAEGELFKSSKPGDLSYVGHLRGYLDFTESTNLDFGASYSQGHNAAGIVDDVDVGRFTTELFGVDATFRWRPLTPRDLSPVRGADRIHPQPSRSVRRAAESRRLLRLRRLSIRAPLVDGRTRSIDPTGRTTRRCSIAASRSC